MNQHLNRLSTSAIYQDFIISDVKKIKTRATARKAQQPQKNQYKFKSNTKGIENHTLDCGDTKYAAKFSKSMEYIANCLQCTQDYGGIDIGASI